LDPACHSDTVSDPDKAYYFDADADPDHAYLFDADPHPYPTFHFAADLDPSFPNKSSKPQKCSNRLKFQTFWLVIC
jgi:hypothetical protein